MKIRLILILPLFLLLGISILQLFNVPPYAGDVFSIYRSGYFDELDRQFTVIRKAFLDLKTMSRPEHAWIFLEDLEREQNIRIRVYDREGRRVPAPGRREGGINANVALFLDRSDRGLESGVSGKTYRSLVPVPWKERCAFCHEKPEGKLMGAMEFERRYNARVYYSSERIMIFSIISIVIIVLIIIVLRWDPHRDVKELFDK
jgi:hypothetical protein